MNLLDHADTLPRYRDWAPTSLDTPGIVLEDRQDWIVAPCSRNRDSEPLDESNFEAAQAILDQAGVEYETHRFGHWACGWFEILLVHPDAAECVAGIACSLADYPCLDEEDLSEREHEAEWEDWLSWGEHNYARALAKHLSLADATVDWLLRNEGPLRDLQSEHACERGDYRVHHVTRAEVAHFIVRHRKAVRS